MTQKKKRKKGLTTVLRADVYIQGIPEQIDVANDFYT